jgi:hypothetical protein
MMTTEPTLKPVTFDPKSPEYVKAVTKFYDLKVNVMPLTSVVRCITFTPGIYDVASATNPFEDFRVVKMQRLGDTWACSCPAQRLCWHIAAAAATHHYTQTETYNPIHIMNRFCAIRNDKQHPDWAGCFVADCKHKEMFDGAQYCQVHYDAAEDLKKAIIETAHDPERNHALTCGGCLVAAGTPNTSHWSAVSSDYWKCRKMWGLGRCGGRAVSVGGYCATCAAAGWDDLQAGR